LNLNNSSKSYKLIQDVSSSGTEPQALILS